MNGTLVRALIALVLVSLLIAHSVASFLSNRTTLKLLQLIGAACLLVVVLAHLAEGAHLLQSMRWGARDSIGHDVDLAAAVLAVTLLAIGLPVRLWLERRSDPRSTR